MTTERSLLHACLEAFLRMDAALARKARALLAIELILALAIVATAGIALWDMLHAMATTSLWNDELYSIINFSSLGPRRVVTDYHVANNHIFYNLVNALTPGSRSVMPLRARMWSFAAVLGSLGLLLSHFARRRRYLEGAVVFALIAAQERILDLTLQARGYGFLCLATVVVTLAVVRYVETRQTRDLVIIAVASVLGTYTIPTFIVFAGVLLLMSWVWFRTRAIFYCGASVVLVVAGLYSLVFDQLMHEMATYKDNWGEAYAELSAVVETLSHLWPDISSGLALLTLAFALVVPYHLAPGSGALAARFFSLVVVLTLAVFLLQRTPAVRTTFFVVVPLAVVLVLIGSQVLRTRLVVPWLAAQLVVAGLSLSIIEEHNRQFSFTPMEAWLEVARFIHATVPPGTSVVVPFRGEYLRRYLKRAYPIVEEFDPEAFAAGTQVHVDGDFFARKTFNGRRFSPVSEAVRIPQRRGSYQAVAWVPR